jgi:hypothetical protein
MKILGRTQEEILKIANECFDLISEDANKNGQDRNAGLLTIRIAGEGYNKLHKVVGNAAKVSSVDLNRWSDNSKEKAGRLNSNFIIGHISSEQSRDFDNKKYRGSIYTGEVIVSFSGLSEHDDEALCLMIAYRLKWMDWKSVSVIAEISKNPSVPGRLKDLPRAA